MEDTTSVHATGAGDPRRRLGAEGEARAAGYLRRRGYRIVQRNLRAGGVEIDLVAVRGRHLAFVEVKTRRSERCGAGLEALSPSQRARLVRGAAAWLAGRPPAARSRLPRFDLVDCRVDRAGRWRIRHWPGAFDAEG